MDSKKEVLSFYDYNVGDKVEYAGEQYVVTNVQIDKTDPTGFTGHAGLAKLNSDGTASKDAEFFIDAPTQALIITGETSTTVDPDATVMDFDKIEGNISAWSSFTSSFSSSVPRASENSGFKQLMAAGLESGFAASFDRNIESLVSALNQTKSTLTTNLDNMGAEDSFVESDAEKTLGSGRPKRKSGGGGSSYEAPSSTQLVNNSKQQLEQYQKMSMNDLSKIAEDLNKYGLEVGKTPDELLTNAEYSEKIKNLILKNQNTSNELKKLIEIGEVDITQKILLSIFNGNTTEISGISDSTIITLEKHLKRVANENNLDLNALINDKQNSYLLKTSLKQFGKVYQHLSDVNEQTINNELLNIYDGNTNKMDSSSMNIIRDYVDNLASSNNTNTESLLTNQNSLIKEIDTLGRTSVFTNSLANCTSESMSEVLKKLFK